MDKHDLLRTAMPGYVFFLVMFIFALADGIQSSISSKSELLILLAGFPIGYGINFLYRILFHITVFGCTCRRSEQQWMEEKDADLILEIVGEKRKNNTDNKLLSNLLLFTFQNSSNKTFQERCDHLMSQIHSLGASSLAIVLAVFSWPACKLICGSYIKPSLNLTPLLCAICVLVIFVFWIGRSGIIVSYEKARMVFAAREFQDIKKGWNDIKIVKNLYRLDLVQKGRVKPD